MLFVYTTKWLTISNPFLEIKNVKNQEIILPRCVYINHIVVNL